MINYSWCLIQFRYTFYCFHLACWHRWIHSMEMAKNIQKPFQLIKSKTYAWIMNRLFHWMWQYVWVLSFLLLPMPLDSGCFVFGIDKWVSYFILWPGKVAYEMHPCWLKDHCFFFSCLAYSLVINWIEMVKLIYSWYANLHL